MIRMPTHWMLMETTTASSEAKALSIQNAGMPRLRANDGLMESTSSWLKSRPQAMRPSTKTTANAERSSGVIDRMSPIMKEENLLKPPPWLMIMRPSAMAVAEKTPMIVSVEAVLLFLM